jgi:uncharacterized protein DUF2188
VAKELHVFRNGERWKVSRDSKSLSTHKTQREAIDAAMRSAQKQGVDLVIHGRDGRIRSRDSYAPYESDFFSDSKSKGAIIGREIVVPSVKPSVSKKKISNAIYKVWSSSGYWVTAASKPAARARKK